MDHPQDPPGDVQQVVKPPQIHWWKIAVLILVLLLALGVAIAIPTLKTLSLAKDTLNLARETYTLGKNQDLAAANAKLAATKLQLERTRTQYQVIKWTKFIPLIGAYWQDGNHFLNAALAGIDSAQIIGSALEPYADVLGFKGQGSFLGGTAEDRIVTAVQTLEKVMPEIDKVADKLKVAETELAQINPHRYPSEVKGKPIRSLVVKAQTLSHDAVIAVTDARPVIELLPQVMGVDSERKYLVLFQNDAELRATGGFMTAYGILRLDKGRVGAEKSDDIYTLDAKFRQRLQTPDPIKKYLPLVFYWHLRDMNLSPDFKVSMDTFTTYYQTLPGEPAAKQLTGVIAVDTQVLKHLLDVLGPIEVPGFGAFTSDIEPICNCPQVIYQMELIADRPVATIKDSRKGVIGPMMQTILLKAYGSPKAMWPKLVETVVRDINEKHILFYFFEDKFQQAAEGISVAGRIKDYQGDYFHLNDTNFGGAKSNMFVEQAVDQEITISAAGEITKKVTVTYKNPQPPSNCNLEAGQLCLNGTLRDFVRLYVPAGSTLVEALGFEPDTVKTNEDLGKTVFEGFFQLQPQSQAKIIFTYKLPFQASAKDYQLLIQKQPGTKAPHYTVTINDQTQEFDLTVDKEVQI